MKTLLDTNTCIAWLNGTSRMVRARLTTARQGDLSICSVVRAELLYGAHKSARVEQNLEKLEVFFGALESLPFDDSASDYYGRIRAFLEQSGSPIGPHDLMIAAIALSNGSSVLTRNMREFKRVPGLTVHTWTPD